MAAAKREKVEKSEIPTRIIEGRRRKVTSSNVHRLAESGLKHNGCSAFVIAVGGNLENTSQQVVAARDVLLSIGADAWRLSSPNGCRLTFI